MCGLYFDPHATHADVLWDRCDGFLFFCRRDGFLYRLLCRGNGILYRGLYYSPGRVDDADGFLGLCVDGSQTFFCEDGDVLVDMLGWRANGVVILNVCRCLLVRTLKAFEDDLCHAIFCEQSVLFFCLDRDNTVRGRQWRQRSANGKLVIIYRSDIER